MDVSLLHPRARKCWWRQVGPLHKSSSPSNSSPHAPCDTTTTLHSDAGGVGGALTHGDKPKGANHHPPAAGTWEKRKKLFLIETTGFELGNPCVNPFCLQPTFQIASPGDSPFNLPWRSFFPAGEQGQPYLQLQTWILPLVFNSSPNLLLCSGCQDPQNK